MVGNIADEVPKMAGINGRIRVLLEAFDHQPGHALPDTDDARLDAVGLEDLKSILEPQVRGFRNSRHFAEQIHGIPVVDERQTRGFVSENRWRFVGSF